jgi:uncharacterized protein
MRRRAVPEVVLRETPVVDCHCHGWTNSATLALDPGGFLDRITLTGSCLTASADGRTLTTSSEDHLHRLTDLTPFALAMQTRLAARLGAEPTREAVSRARRDAFSASPEVHVKQLWADAHIAGLFIDDGSPRIPSQEMEREAGVPVFRVARIEPWIEDIRADARTYGDLEDRFCALAEEAAGEDLVAFKSIIGYIVGLDVVTWRRSDVAAAYRRWRDSGFEEDRTNSKPVRDTLLWRVLAIARDHDRAVHIHSGAGDSSIILEHARPKDLFPLLKERTDQSIVLVHSGWPWVEEGAYLAAVFPNVHLDTSVTTPWYSLALEQKLETMMGLVSAGKIMYGSDHKEPEAIWLSAVLAREGFERILSRGVEHGWFDEEAGVRMGESILGSNAIRLHGVESRLTGSLAVRA